VVDALFGTGVERALDPIMVKVIDIINACPATVVSADIPSGLDADTGATWGHVVAADITATYGHIKRGMLLFPGAASCGRIEVIPIGAPAKASEEAGADGLILCDGTVQSFMPSRRRDAHKGTCGHLAVVAGSMGKSGAAVMTGQAALRTGAGLVTIATTQNARPTVESRCLEIMVDTVIEKVDAALTDKSVKNAVALMEGKTAVALGPGLTTAPGISALAVRLLQSLEIPAVVDADGVNILAADPSGAGRITTPMVLTPHPGEMARLMGKSVAQVQADRIGTAREAARWHKVVIVLKGAHSIIASPEGDIWMNPTGNPGMATAGMGDVLTGIIGGLLAQGVEPVHAALLGTYLHGLAADRCSVRTGHMGLIAGDVIDELPSLLREWECAAREE